LAVIPLSRLLELESTHTVCFDRHGEEVAWPDFLSSVARISAALTNTEGRYWAIDIADACEFACALYGCWIAGKTPVLAPKHMLDGAVRYDGIVREGFGTKVAELGDPVIRATSDLVLFTSGSTGEPTKVYRRINNIEAELDVLDALFGSEIGDGRVYSTVSHEHVYGLLFRLLWPLVPKRAFASFNFEYPENLLSDVSSDGALVTSPALLKRLGHLDAADASHWRIVFSSGGLIPDYAAHDAMRLLGTCPVEVLGSTETSGVAWRRQDEHGAAEVWHTLPEVRVRQDEEGFLEVSSPFMGLSNWHRMGDKVRLESNRSFELLGRGDHIVKIEEKRVSLAEIEQRAIELPDVADAAATPLEDGARQFVGLVLQLSDSGKKTLDEHGRKDIGRQLRAALGDKLDPIAVPKKLRYVDVIPVNPQGKRRPAEIRALFD
jgi:acyl-coenzyme A synthetase/AMP-(fatty) acid ligase